LPPAPLPQEIVPHSIPYDPSIRIIVFTFGFTLFLCAAGAFMYWPLIVQAVVAVLSFSLAILLCLRRYLWPQQILLRESTMTVPVGFLRMRPMRVNYGDITGVWVVLIGPILCVRTSQRIIEIPVAFLPNQETFALLKSHFDSLVPAAIWDDEESAGKM
jgi:hypothetical protein